MLSFLREADQRIERFQFDHHIPGFVPSDFPKAYRMLRSLVASELATGNLFCEWGSGYGVVTCLAAMLDFDAWGIEIEGDLVDAARRLASDFDLPAQFIRGSFIPKGSEVSLDDNGFAWLTTDGEDLRDEMDLGIDDFNVIFAYPWPDEERTVDRLFERHAAEGAILFTCHENGTTQLRRKMKEKRRRIDAHGPTA